MLKPTRETPLLGNGGLVVAAMIAVMLLGAVPYQAQESPMVIWPHCKRSHDKS